MQEAMLERKMFMKQFGKDMKKARREQGMTQNELAAQMQLLGVDASSDRVRKIENGIYRITGQELLVISFILLLDLQKRMEDYVTANVAV